MDERTSRILYGINEETSEYYHSLLKGDQGKMGIACLKELGLTEETSDRFKLGYSGSAPQGLINHLKDRGYLDAQIIEAGLADTDERGAIEDIFQNRVIIPIVDDEYRVIGFSGKSVNNDSPIYLNTRETSVFDKSRSLFGLDHVKDSEAQYIILCEGFVDVMILQQVGYDMYVKLLNEAVQELNGQDKEDIVESKIDISLNAYLPNNYISSNENRISFYTKVSKISTQEQLNNLLKETELKYGNLPNPVKQLCFVGFIKNLAQKLYIKSIKLDEFNFKITFYKEVMEKDLYKLLNRTSSSYVLTYENLPIITLLKKNTIEKSQEMLINFLVNLTQENKNK